MVGQMMVMAAKPVAFLLQNARDYSNDLTPDQQFEIAREAVRHGPDSAVAYLVPLGLFAMIVLVVWLGTRRRQAQIKAQTEVRKQLIDKFGSVPEFTAFLDSKGGRDFFGAVHSHVGDPLRFLPGGLVTTMLGLAFLGLTLMRRNFIIPAVLLLAMGLGLLISTAIAYKLASDNKNGQTINPRAGMQPLPPA
jgi:hypothetical protein